jgi:hypothetical protein
MILCGQKKSGFALSGEAPLDAVFGFVSGHDFSRAVKERKRIGL